MGWGRPRRSCSASRVSSQAQLMLDLAPWPRLLVFKLFERVTYFLPFRRRQGVVRVHELLGLHGQATVLGCHLHKVSFCQSELLKNFLGDHNLTALADAAQGGYFRAPFGLNNSARHTFRLSAYQKLSRLPGDSPQSIP